MWEVREVDSGLRVLFVGRGLRFSPYNLQIFNLRDNFGANN